MKSIGRNRTLGRLSAAVAICMIMVLASAITAVGVSLKQGNLISTNFMSYSFDFSAPGLGAVSQNGAGYTSLSMVGCVAHGQQAGDPAMPVRVVQLMLPPQKAVYKINVFGTPVSVPLSGVNLIAQPIVPEQRPVPLGDQPAAWALNADTYTKDVNYPSTLSSHEQVGYSHGYAILSLNLNPVQYNPKQGTLVYYPKLTVVISLKTDTSVNKLYRDRADDLAYVKTLVSNPDVADLYSSAHLPVATYSGGICSSRESYGYVLVTTTWNGLDHWDIGGTLTYNWDSLLAKHSGEGLSSTEVLVQDIKATPAYWNGTSMFNDTQAQVREFCKDAYANWGTKYMLFGGDDHTQALPARDMSSDAEYGVDADIYWSNLDNDFNADHDSSWGEEGDSGFDFYWEVAIGRVVCEQPQDVSNWLTKCFTYTDSSEADYLDNAAFYGGDTGWNCQGDDFMDYSAIKGTNTWLGPNPDQFPSWVPFQFGFETWNENNLNNQFNLSVKYTEAPNPNPGWSGAGVQGLRDAINNDLCTIISGIAHANNEMSLDVYDSEWQTQYHNTKPFFLHDYGCHCGDFDAGNGVLDTMLFMSDTKLAYACVYNTGYGWGNFDCTNSSSAFQTKEFWGWFLDVVNHSGDMGNWQFGVAMGWSKDQMVPMIDWSYGTWREIIQCCLLFGDPAMMLKSPHPSEAPLKPSKPVGQTLGIWHVEYSYTSSTTDPNGDQIYYLFDWDDGSTSGWLGPYTSGQTVTGKHTWTQLGNYSVKVKAKDTWGAGSPASDILLVTITDNTPPLPPQISGPKTGVPGTEYRFDFQTTDPQDQEIWYFVDWGDDTTSGWLGPYVSGHAIHLMHSWSAKGAYNVRAKAKDTMDMESAWSNMTVTMPLNLIFSETQSQQLLYTTVMGLPYHQNG